jgi:hypothetical protein
MSPAAGRNQMEPEAEHGRAAPYGGKAAGSNRHMDSKISTKKIIPGLLLKRIADKIHLAIFSGCKGNQQAVASKSRVFKERVWR